MDKYAAGKLEGMLVGARNQLGCAADHLRDVCPPEKLKERMLMIATALSELVHLSWEIYEEHPELNPEREAWERTAAERAERQRRGPPPSSSC